MQQQISDALRNIVSPATSDEQETSRLRALVTEKRIKKGRISLSAFLGYRPAIPLAPHLPGLTAGGDKWYSRLNSWGHETTVRCGLATANALRNSLSLLADGQRAHAERCQELTESWLADPTERAVTALRRLDPPHDSSCDKRRVILEHFVYLALLPLSQPALPEMMAYAEAVLDSFADSFSIAAPDSLTPSLLDPANSKQTILDIVGFALARWALQTAHDPNRSSRLQKKKSARPLALRDAIESLCGLGIFDRSRNLTEELQSAFQDTYGVPFDETRSAAYCDLVALNRDRVWVTDGEEDVAKDNNVYVSVIERLARISSDKFAPSQISELWASDTGPITVSFRLNSKSYTCRPRHLNDFIDTDIVDVVNQAIADTGFQFYRFQSQAMSYFMYLSPHEYESLCGVLGLRSS
jgi:hypothetical protein